MTQSDPVLGSIESMWRYPVKSMAGEELTSSAVTERGLVGDRAYALIDTADGKVVTAKNPRKWPQLFEFAAAFADTPRNGDPFPPIRITLPDGATVASNETDVDATLSGALHRRVRMQAAERGAEPVVSGQRADRWVARSEEYWPDLEGLEHRDTVTDFDLPEGTFFDAAVVHLVTRATFSQLSELYPEGRMAVRRFRPNFVVATPETAHGFVENSWVGHTVSIGEQVRMQITQPCGRCVMVTLPQGDLPKDSGILRTVAQHNEMNVGVYATVLRGGQVRRGDAVTVL